MKLEKEALYWSLPVILWMLHQTGVIEILGLGRNHNETLLRDKV